jgi:hypothetical protein
MGSRKPKRLKTGDKPNEEVVKVKVESDNNKEEEEEEESSDDDDNEEEEEQVGHPLARVKRPAYVESRPDYILMDCNESMGDVVIPDNKVIRQMNPWCYTKLYPVHWGDNSIDGCGSGPTGRRCLICCNGNMIYVCMLIILKDGKGEEITRIVDTQWISRIFEATHINAQANRVQVTPSIDPWGYATMGWVKNKMIENTKT